jgi:hypothetical protein
MGQNFSWVIKMFLQTTPRLFQPHAYHFLVKSADPSLIPDLSVRDNTKFLAYRARVLGKYRFLSPLTR